MDQLSENLPGIFNLRSLLQSNGHIEYGLEGKPGVRLILKDTDDRHYSNAQLDDYQGRPDGKTFTWRPPLRMTVRAYASHAAEELRGTAGFGFWSQPLLPGRILPFRPVIPGTVWFFFSSKPSDMSLAKGVPGYGWKAATLDATRLPFWLLLPSAPIAVLLMRIPALYRWFYPVGQWAAGISEALIEVDVREPHLYRLDWLRGSAEFYVDDRLVHRSPFAPSRSLGFVAWSDNRYAIVTPQGRIAAGLLPIPGRQWWALEMLTITLL